MVFFEGYADGMKQVNFFLCVCFVIKSVGNNIFLLPTNLPTDKKLLMKIHRRSISVGDFISKLITDGICVLCRRKNFIDKTVKSCSEQVKTLEG